MKAFSRRDFLGATLGTTAAMTLLRHGVAAQDSHLPEDEKFTILFQGDSITDGNRGRSSDPNHILGHGYAFAIAAELGSKYPSRKLSFINKGVSGDKVSDLLKRWTPDALELKPDLLSILVGVNDILADLERNSPTFGRDVEQQYREFLSQVKRTLPKTLIVLGEPFILPVGMVARNPELWNNKIKSAQKIIRNLASEFNATLVPYQKMFDDACNKAAADYWIWDGIHPTYAGHGLMASLWIDTVGKVCNKVAVTKH